MTAYISQYFIDGVIDTSKSVLENIETLCTASGCWMTWDPAAGQWSVVINAPGASTSSFNDDNIIGNINVSGTGIDGLYNAVTVEFPHGDLLDTTDYVDITLPTNQRYSRELDNKLQLRLDCINNAVQAQLIGSRELKQSRVDKVIEFTTDYTKIGIKAGDLIDVTSSMYFYTNKIFRVISVEETDGDDGSLLFKITALEYSADVYTTTGLVRKERNKKTGVIPKSTNTALTALDLKANGNLFAQSMGDPASLNLILAALNTAGVPKVESVSGDWSVAQVTDVFGAGNTNREFNRFTYETSAGSGLFQNIKNHPIHLGLEWQTFGSIKTMTVNFNGPQGRVNYTVDGVNKFVDAGVPAMVSLFYANNSTGPWYFQDQRYMEWSTYLTNFSVSDISGNPVYWYLMVTPLNTYDLNATQNYITINSVSTVYPSGSGSGSDVTIVTFLT